MRKVVTTRPEPASITKSWASISPSPANSILLSLLIIMRLVQQIDWTNSGIKKRVALLPFYENSGSFDDDGFVPFPPGFSIACRR